MNKTNLANLINYIIEKTVALKDKYTNEGTLEIDYVCIFSQNIAEFNELMDVVSKDGKLVWDSPTGPVYSYPFDLKGYCPKLLRIRKPDETRLERGDVDFNSNYLEFKNKYLNQKNFKLIERGDYEMIELMDPGSDVRVYFSSQPLSRTLGVS